MREASGEVDHWEQIPEGDEEAMKCYIATVGPLAIEMVVGKTSFNSYDEGIWDDPEKNCTGRVMDHVSLKISFILVKIYL